MKERDIWVIMFIYQFVIVFCWLSYIHTNITYERDEWKQLALNYSNRYDEVIEQNKELSKELNEYSIYDQIKKDMR